MANFYVDYLNRLDELHTDDGQKFSVSWSLLHVLDHTAIHLGHIQLTRQLWEQSGR